MDAVDVAVFDASRLFGGDDRDFQFHALLMGFTEVCPGTAEAFRFAVRQAHRGAEVHEGLVVVAGALFGHTFHVVVVSELFGGRFLDVLPVQVAPGIDTQQVAVHRGHGLSERDRRDGRRRVLPDAGELLQFLRGPRDLSAVVLHDGDCRLVHVPDPAVIAEAFPEFQVRVLLGFGEGRHIRQGRKEPGIVVFDRFHPGLLEHDLRDPDVVGRRVLPPGKDAPFRVIPVQ